MYHCFQLKLSTFALQKTLLRELKGKRLGKISVKHTFDKGFSLKYKKKSLKSIRKQRTQLKVSQTSIQKLYQRCTNVK